MVTMREVAARARVSQKTVSRVFNDDPHVRPETRERVRGVMRDLGYVANPIAGVFRSGRVPVLGIAVPDVGDPFFAVIVSAVDAVAREADMSTLVASLGHDPDREEDVVRNLLRRAPSGLIMAPVGSDQGYLDVTAAGLPVVFVDREPVGHDSDVIHHDDAAGVRLAVEHLIEHGHRRIAFTGDSSDLPTTRERLRVHREVLREHGLDCRPEFERLGVVDERTADEAIRGITGLAEPPTAVFSSNAACTMLLVPPLLAAGLSLVSFGDFPMASSIAIPVCVVDQDPAEMGSLAAERILARARARARARGAADSGAAGSVKRTVLPVRLIHRGSCLRRGPAPTA